MAAKTVSVGERVALHAGGLIVGQKYGSYYAGTLFKWQTSADGGATWSDGTGVTDTNWYEDYVEFSTSLADNGRKWSGVLEFNSQSVTSRVATLTVV